MLSLLGPCKQLRGSDLRSDLRRVTHQASLSGPRPIIVPPSVVNGGGRDPDQITHQKAHEAKSGVSRVSVRACARGRGGEDNCMPARSSCASSCQEVGSLTMRVTRVTLAHEAWRAVTGGGVQSMERLSLPVFTFLLQFRR